MVWLAVFAVVSAKSATAPDNQRTYTGILTVLNLREHTLTAEGTLLSREFVLSPECVYTLPDQSTGAVTNLRPGENISVRYQDVAGVLIASRVAQRPMCFEGMVEDIDYGKSSVTVYFHELDKVFNVATNCDIILRDGKRGAFTNILKDSHVRVTYEIPDETPTARRIEQTSIVFTGTLKALDLAAGTLKARTGFHTKDFKIAKDCAVAIHDKPAQLSDLKLDGKFVFCYDLVKGANVVNRIVPAAEYRDEALIDEFKVDL